MVTLHELICTLLQEKTSEWPQCIENTSTRVSVLFLMLCTPIGKPACKLIHL